MSAPLPSQVLDAAADLIEPEGAWTQGAYGRDGYGVGLDERELSEAKCFCVSGAIIRVGDGNELWRACLRNFEAAVGDGFRSFIQWNDAPERTQAEVVSALRKAADIARSEGQ